MEQNSNYFRWMENVNIKNLHDFNNKTKWFTKIEPTKEFTHSDAVCYTKDNRKITVELKTRKETNEQFKGWGDVIIEPKKLSHFTDVMESGYTLNENCLYINFTANGAIIYSFNDLKTPARIYPNHRQWNPGKRKYEFETRIGLDIKDAIIYHINEDSNYVRET